MFYFPVQNNFIFKNGEKYLIVTVLSYSPLHKYKFSPKALIINYQLM